ncbi:MAG: DJ-1/PfpI family protein [Victivallaceae bacterium]|nr:DJ-1/PfpI family protein [Victivallaceae bacterium]
MTKKILVVLADGFEEIEALGAVDVLRRLQLDVVTASLNGKNPVSGAHRILVDADRPFADCAKEDFDAVVLPGGMPGAENLRQSAALRDFLQTMARQGKIVAAICAAPMVLANAGLLDGKRFTMYPGFEAFLHGLTYTSRAAERDGNIVTGRGPGALFDFCREIAAALGCGEKIPALYEGMFVQK